VRRTSPQGASPGYEAPRLEDYGSLEELTGDGGLLHHVGIRGGLLAAAASLPTVPSDVGGVAGTPGASAAGTAPPPFDAGPGTGHQGIGDAAGGGAPSPGDSGVLGGAGAVVGATGGGQGTVPGSEELPFTGANLAATAAAGAASTAAGFSLRRLVRRRG
jgi:hypothetical protein